MADDEPHFYDDETGIPIVTFVEPLTFPAADPRHAKDHRLDDEAVLKYMCVPGVEPDPEEMGERYREITLPDEVGFVSPSGIRILERLVWPLRRAKCRYMVGDYLGTIESCGTIGEMVAILLFDMEEPTFGGSPITSNMQEKLFGAEFDSLDQSRRVKVLHGLGIITDNETGDFGGLRQIRRKYLHYFEYEREEIKRDAVTAYRHAFRLVMRALGPHDPKDPYALNPKLEAYLTKRGIPIALRPPKETGWTERTLAPGTMITQEIESFSAAPPEDVGPKPG